VDSVQMMKRGPYKRLRRMGLGSHILAVSSPKRGHGGGHFIVHDHQAFLQALLSSGTFGLDRAVGRVFHRGTISLREVSSKAGLHLCVGRNNSVDVHVDVVPPVVGTTPTGRCRYAPGRVTAHLRHDVFPMILRRHVRRRPMGSLKTATVSIPSGAGVCFRSGCTSKWSMSEAAIPTVGEIFRPSLERSGEPHGGNLRSSWMGRTGVGPASVGYRSAKALTLGD
jgi:hypothetical protein